MKARYGCTFAMLFTLAACSGKHRPFADDPIEGLGGSSGVGPTTSERESAGTSLGPGAEPTATEGEPLGGVSVETLSPPGDAVQNSGSLTCGADAATCGSPDTGQAPPACIPTGPRDCTSDADNDCDGLADNTLDDVCGCVSGTSEPCDEHTGLDGQGQCRAGLRTCLLDEVTLTSAWGECEGAVGPGDADSCAPGDDADCDGTPNEGCTCVDGATQPCGSDTNTGPCNIGTSTCVDGRFGPCIGAVAPASADSCSSRNDDSNCNGVPFDGCSCANGETQSCGMTDTGVCQLGTRTCVNGAFGQCVGQVNPRSRDCRSPLDNDCDGRPDNVIDGVCQCSIGSSQACQTHPGQDGSGPCRAGSQQCVAGQNNSSSFFGACSGSVGPAARDCRSLQDNNCDGRADNTIDNVCQCSIGSSQACQTHPGQDGVGRCRAGSQQCVAGQNNTSTFFGACSGSVGPAARDCRSLQDNDCDGRPDNTIDGVCECVPGGGNAPCSDDPNNSRCNDQGRCAPCQADSDCSFIGGGRQFCSRTAGQCVARFACGDAAPRSVTRIPTEALSSSAAPSTGGTILDGEYVQTERFVSQLGQQAVFYLGDSYAFRGQFAHWRTIEFFDENDPGGLTFEGVGTYSTSGSTLTIAYSDCLFPGQSGSLTRQYSVTAAGLQIISAGAGAATGGRFVRQ
jgi:hypothetical protein